MQAQKVRKKGVGAKEKEQVVLLNTAHLHCVHIKHHAAEGVS